ncbi:MAG: FxsA family protein [Beijerinckiaceae bacterium]
MFAFHLVAGWTGGLLAFLLFVLKSVAGFAFVGRLVRHKLKGLAGFRIVSLEGRAATEAGLKVLGAILLVVPGFLAGLVGLALLTPSFRGAWLRRTARRTPGPREIDLTSGDWRDTTPSRRRIRRKSTNPDA